MNLESETIVSRSPEQTLEFGKTLAHALTPGDMVLLQGSLGAGKTVLAKGIINGLGATGWRGSPTFSLVNEYEGSPTLVHMDLYRLTVSEVEAVGIEDYVHDDTILVVEWGDRAAPYLDSLALRTPVRVEVLVSGPQERTIEVSRAMVSPGNS